MNWPRAARSAAIGLVLTLTACATPLWASPAAARSPQARPQPALGAPAATPTPTAPPTPEPMYASGDPAALPGDLLIADRDNSRLLELDPKGDIVWSFPAPGYRGPIPFSRPDDAFFSPGYNRISTNEEFENTAQVVQVGSRKVVWTYGFPGAAGAAAGHLNGPDDAHLLADGTLVVTDIKNCRILFLRPDHTSTQLGHTGACAHDPARGYFDAPNGALPNAAQTELVVSEIGGNYVDVFSLPSLAYEYSFRAPTSYISDALLLSDGDFLMSDYSDPGAVYITDRKGRVLWRYGLNLNHPSISIPLPNGDIVISDDWGDRVLIVDPKTNRVVWQYGHLNRPGSAAGYLRTPDGLDFKPAPAPVAPLPPEVRTL